MWQGWVVGILGVWQFIVAFLKFTPTVNMWDNIIVGIIAAIAGFWMVKDKPWQGWISGIVSLWLIIAGFIPALTKGSGVLWNDIIVGIILAIAGFAALGKKKEQQQ